LYTCAHPAVNAVVIVTQPCGPAWKKPAGDRQVRLVRGIAPDRTAGPGHVEDQGVV